MSEHHDGTPVTVPFVVFVVCVAAALGALVVRGLMR